jgi:hypothetical protein
MAQQLPVKAGQGTRVNRSGSIAVAGTAQNLMPVNATRSYLFIQNLSTGDLWINELGTAAAAAPSILIRPYAAYESGLNVPTTAFSIFGATAGQAFSAREA